ncbi:52 kDa repressor of the inhibitor of the protein kinase-like [Nilaparvata lugens]|uniref:52 kDa repressor of the inhibitor of the protein kinase-like n=1 Tax=Nilaparvata lugens TaxID=108931 RepID=UPI00193EA5B2|nr:52 kDa repressor of the inhibitor of the protein kinase-like [Nilaparvata lugens]
MEVNNLINEERLSQSQKNRQKLLSIVKTVILLGRQNIPMRGHRDDGPLNLEMSDTVSNEGNFRALIKFRIDAGDKVLEDHINTSSSRSTYISKSTQNNIIECCKAEITDVILSRIAKAELYSIMFDETSDISQRAQVSIVLRYVHFEKEFEIREDFITFIDAFEDMKEADEDNLGDERSNSEVEMSISGKNLGAIILRKIDDLKLPFDKCIGIGTDGCSVMLSDNGAVKEIQKVAKNAITTPCYNHKLNNSISKCSNIKLIENSVSVLKEVIAFFSFPKRNTALKNFLGKKMTHLCETRWTERHDGVLQFTTSLPDILACLHKISEWKDKKTSGKASLLITALCDSKLIIGLFCLSDILSLSLPLSRILQKETLDLCKSAELLNSLLELLNERRQNSIEYFNCVYMQAQEIARKLDVELKIPRLCGRQTQRSNHPSATTEEYFRLTVYVPVLDNIIQDLKTRFTSDVLNVFHLPLLLPEGIVNTSVQDMQKSIDPIMNRFGSIMKDNRDLSSLKLNAEMAHWRNKWQRYNKEGLPLPTNALNVLRECEKDIYPTIHFLLRVLCTLPVSNASSERSFSTLRLLKTWLRSTMSENRLVGLALLYIHPDIVIDPEKIVERFAKSGTHRIIL